MSHELRTPLNAINGFAETLLNAGPDDPLTDYQQDRLTRILQSGRKLLELINTLLDLAKIEAGKMEVTLQRFELSVVLQEVFELVEPLAEPKALQLKLELEATDWQCQTDEGKLRQVFINLLGNAVKFTPKDGVVRVRASCEEGWVTVAIEDNGPGIDKQQLEHIFEVFEQATSHSSTSGTGLGLAIVQNLMQLLVGTISVSSEPGSGSTFLVRFPAAHPTLSLE
jgi:signal transduction histidine kinase